MLIKRTSKLTGVERELDIPVTPEQMADWKCGTLIQQAMPHLTADQREFIMSGTTKEEWDMLDVEDDEDPDKRYHR